MYQYRMAVCEDDETVREGICGFCDRILTEEQIPHQIAAFSSAEELEACLAENRGSDEPAFHLLILDILMGEKTGMELAMELREEDDATGIIFITGCEEYMGMGYDVQAIQFLVKPLNWEKLKKALLNDWRKKGRQDLLLIKKGRQSLQLPLSGILYAEADGNHGIRIILKEGEESFPVSLSELEEMASGPGAARHGLRPPGRYPAYSSAGSTGLSPGWEGCPECEQRPGRRCPPVWPWRRRPAG